MDLTNQFECVVCLHLASDPAQQTSCGQVYCKECLAPCKLCPVCREPLTPCGHLYCGECLAFGKLCPVCREPLNASSAKLLHEVNKMGMRMMLDFKVCCFHTKTAEIASCRAKGLEIASPHHFADRCTWQGGSYGDLLAKHACECPRQEVDCPHGCRAVDVRRVLKKHLQSF